MTLRSPVPRGPATEESAAGEPVAEHPAAQESVAEEPVQEPQLRLAQERTAPAGRVFRPCGPGTHPAATRIERSRAHPSDARPPRGHPDTLEGLLRA